MIEIGRILHAGYVIKSQGAQIVFDPLFESPFSRNCYAFPDVIFDLEKIRGLYFDAIFISHHHDDHFSLESLNLLNRDCPIYMYSIHAEHFLWLKRMGFKNVSELRLDVPVQIADITITPKRALDKYVDCLLKVEVGPFKILNVVDSWIDWQTLERLRSEGPWDLIMWPFQTMREIEVIAPTRFLASDQKIPTEHLEQIALLSPRYLIPSSCQFIHEEWSWYRQHYFPVSYEGFSRQIDETLPKTILIKMDPSQVYRLESEGISQARNLDFITVSDRGKLQLDYDYQPQSRVPSTREISQNFERLAPEKVSELLQFIAQDLPQRYRALQEEEGLFFSSPRIWCLALYNKGEELLFYFAIEGAQIDPLSDPRDYSWRTEIPAERLWGALYNGESLTSLYLRVNDQKFSDEIEQELKDVDILEDPLIRVLYAREECLYQKHQLQRLLKE